VSVLFGYPSILREVEYALKRASSDAALEKRDLRSAPVPQSAVGKKTNIARYTYFAVSKYSSFPEAASDFVGFLTTKMAGELYSNSFPQYLPARNDVAEGVKDKRMNASFPWVRYESFIAPNDVRLINFDRSLTSEYEAALSRALDQPNLDAKGILDQVKAQVECRKKQLIERSGFDTSCES
jgi:ABC-type glycerol-3-phosphate transport system substrate-binding protein